jgi:uncharacterized protein YkwD
VLHILNADRAQFHVAPLNLLKIQTYGTHSCVGSHGHSQAMAETDSLWHSRASKPNASFPHNICVAYTTVGENIGESQSGDEVGDLTTINDMMMQEPHSHAVCASTINHACNILNGQFHHVGIGVVFSNGTTWLTEDFTN